MTSFHAMLEEPQPATVAAQQRQTILIIDDDDALSEVLSRRLQQQGFDTLVASSGQSGLASARAERPALIILDLRLPDFDGLAVCEQLADALETCTIPVIVLSGLGQPDVLRRCRAAGCRYFVRKPFDPNVLLILIRQALQEVAAWNGSDG
jgi:DNA-binding response OmpR family regulator